MRKIWDCYVVLVRVSWCGWQRPLKNFWTLFRTKLEFASQTSESIQWGFAEGNVNLLTWPFKYALSREAATGGVL